MTDTQASLLPYLAFAGNAREAMEFYHGLLGGSLFVQTFGEAGMSDDPALKDGVIHAYLSSESINLMASESIKFGIPWMINIGDLK